MNIYMKDHIFEKWRKTSRHDWSSQLYTQLKVHLTPKFFYRLKKSSCFGDYFFKKIFGFGQILEFLCPVEVRKITLKSPPFWLATAFQRSRVWQPLWRPIKNPTICILHYFAPFTCYIWKVRSILVANMPHRCVVGGCSNVRSLENGIGLHMKPFYGNEHPGAKKRRKRWKTETCSMGAIEELVICSKHFKPHDSVRNYALLKDREAPSIPYLVWDSFGINPFPTGVRSYRTRSLLIDSSQPFSSQQQ